MSLLLNQRPLRSRALPTGPLKGVNPRWRFVLELYMTRVPVEHIAELTGYSIPRVYGILKEPECQTLRQQIMRGYDIDFEALYGKVLDALEENLSHPDGKIKNTAVQTWFKEFGRREDRKAGVGREGSQAGTQVSAETVIFNILNQTQVNE